MATVSFRLESKSFPKLLTGCSVMDGMTVPEIENLNVPFFNTMNLDLEGLKLILAQVMSFSSPCRIHLLLGTDVVVMVRSSMYALIRGCHTPDLVRGPLQSTSADLTTMFKRTTEMVQPVIIPFPR